MKAPNFRYVKARSLGEAIDTLERNSDSAVPLAGGQSLLAGLNMRLSTPELLVDISELAELRGIAQAENVVTIGAATTHAEVLASPIIRERLPLLAEALLHVGHVAIRNRGTYGGSLAYADPAAELPACTVALDGTIVLAGPGGRREVKAVDFFTGLLQTDLRPGELIEQIRLQPQDPAERHAFLELSRRHGDFAIAGIACIARLEGKRLSRLRPVYFGCAERAKLADSVAASLSGVELPIDGARDLAAALRRDLDPPPSPGMSAETRLALAEVLTRRALNALMASGRR
jgi:carbon-monoxide dehydrogenase medium subunit